MHVYVMYVYKIHIHYNDVTIMHRSCICRVATSIRSILTYKKRGKIIKFYIIYKVFNAIVKRIFFIFFIIIYL